MAATSVKRATPGSTVAVAVAAVSRGANMMPLTQTRQGLGRSLLQEPGGPLPFCADGGQGERLRPGTGDDDEVDAGWKQVRPCAEALAAEALHAVALHGAADLAGHDEAQARGKRRFAAGRRGVAGRDEQGKMCRVDPATLALGANELVMPAKPAVAAEGEGPRRGMGRRQRRTPYFL